MYLIKINMKDGFRREKCLTDMYITSMRERFFPTK